ncbi:xaa-Pro aminopeptidase-like protein I [Bisporella sp. PMI_857]|nr:xaa-Pro aminopeptidase-like protein I [Bisporella sp. PMI_857]
MTNEIKYSTCCKRFKSTIYKTLSPYVINTSRILTTTQPPEIPKMQNGQVANLSDDEDWSCDEVEEFGALSVNLKSKPTEKYPAKLHARKVAKHLGVKQGLIYLPGLPARLLEDSDQMEVFRQRRYFYYLSGLNLPDCVVTYNIQRDLLTAFIPPLNQGRAVIYLGQNPSPEEIKENYDFDEVSFTPSLSEFLNHFAHKEYGKIYVLHNEQALKGLVSKSYSFKDGSNSDLYVNPFEVSKLQSAMNAARVIKTPYEIKLLRRANAISAQGHTNVLRVIKHLKNETEIEAVFVGTCILNGAKQQSYGVIAGSGENASTLHYMANNEPLKGRQLVCLDAGVDWSCYASDVTRTFPISGEWTKEAKEIYDIVEEMQESCIEMVEPGANYRDIHMHAHKVLVVRLMELGILHNGTFDEIFNAGTSVAFLPHGLGHFMGLEVHDVGDGGNLLYGMTEKSWLTNFHEMRKDPSSSAASILAPNQVITIEPGIYFSRYALGLYLKDKRYSQFINAKLLEKYYPIGGVRIEDDILVTEDGYENITTAPKGAAALKIINGDPADATTEEQTKGWFSRFFP